MNQHFMMVVQHLPAILIHIRSEKILGTSYNRGISALQPFTASAYRSKEIIITKKNKKGKKVEVDIRPMIRNFDLVSLDDNRVTFVSTIATGSKANLNINILIPQILDMLNLDMDPREVGVLRRDLYKVEDGQLVTPL